MSEAPAQDPEHTRRLAMVHDQIIARGVSDPRVLAALRTVPRHRFVPPSRAAAAYDDRALAIGPGQTISQPFIVARMTELAVQDATHRVLEVGAGTGYQAAVLAELVATVLAIEVDPELADRTTRRLAELHYRNVEVRAGDGWHGWPERAPFDAILVTACAPRVPPALKNQLAPGGRLVLPVALGNDRQILRVIERQADGGFQTRDEEPVRFVPLVRS